MKELQIGGKEMQFKRECIPWNKGMKGIHLSRSSEFKKGNQPQNTKYDFCISVRKDKNKKDYKFIRMSKGNWIPLSHFIWESVHEKIPKGYMIVFKDKNQMNFNIENMQMISRAENVMRNYNRIKAGESIRKLYDVDRIRVLYGFKPKTRLLERIKTV